MEIALEMLLASVLAGAAPIVLAALGETITEKAGMINLSLDGSILLSAMAAFAVAMETQSLGLGFLAGAAAGAAVALLVALFTLILGQNQVAVGFVLTLMTRDMAYFLGNPYSRQQGPQTDLWAIPGLEQIPFIGAVLFRHHAPVYLSLAMILACWWYIYRTTPGLKLQAVGENPQAAYARGINPFYFQLTHVVLGGLLVGLAGASFSLSMKAGWGRPQGAEGSGWIALALVIFGGWHPVKTAAGAYLFAFLQVMGIHLQGWLPLIPAQVFQVAPFPLMIFTLLVMSYTQSESFRQRTRRGGFARRLAAMLSGNAPAALGKPFRPD
jgi:simple sugar transport system permease protein